MPQPISAVVVPSSRKPSTLQVFTNSSTCLGTLVIWVSRSEQWMTFTPSFRESRFQAWSFMSCWISSASRPLALPSLSIFLPMSRSPCLVKWEMRPGLAPCSSTAVGPFSLHPPVILRRFMWRQ